MKRVIAKRLYLLVIALILCFGFLFSTIFVNHDTNAYAQVTTENNKMVRQDFIEESTSDSLNNEENYHYSRGIDSEFMIKNVNGNVSVEGGKIVLCFEDKTLNVPNFDFYRIMDKNGETRFYQADTITDDEDCSAFVYIGIFLASKINEKNAIMNLQYGIEEILTLYNIKVVLTGSQVSYF